MYIIHVEILSISVIYSVRFLSFMHYCPKALETNVIYNSAERIYFINPLSVFKGSYHKKIDMNMIYNKNINYIMGSSRMISRVWNVNKNGNIDSFHNLISLQEMKISPFFLNCRQFLLKTISSKFLPL